MYEMSKLIFREGEKKIKYSCVQFAQREVKVLQKDASFVVTIFTVNRFHFLKCVLSQLAFFINLQRDVIGPSATQAGR